MNNKIICKIYYGTPVKWMDKIIPHYNTVKCDFVLFTDMPLKSKGNVKVVKSDMDWFSNFVSKKLGVNYDLHKEPMEHYPLSKHIYDLWPTQGVLFEDYHKGYKWWGHGCMDVIYGDIDKWLSPEYLKDCDIFGNDPDAICGPFSLYRNVPKVNHLFEEIPGWKDKLEAIGGDPPMDEVLMTQVVRKARDEGRIRFKSAFWQGPGSLMIHFNHTKQWPK